MLPETLLKPLAQPYPGVLAAPGKGGQVGESVPLGNKSRLKDYGPGQEWKEIYRDPEGQQKSLEGISLDVKKKGSGTHRPETSNKGRQ